MLGAVRNSRKKYSYFIIGFLILAILLLYILARGETVNEHAEVEIGEKRYQLEVANTDATRTQGLSGRDRLGGGMAMLFVFPEASEQCMWMKDMKFSLDMVWLDASKKIVKVAEGVSPDTYPQAFCGDNAKYVLEFNTGVIKENNLKVGQNLNF